METYSPKKVKVFSDYKLCITFENKEKRIFDMKPYLKDKYFAPLKDLSKFKTARINPITIEWDGEIDPPTKAIFSILTLESRSFYVCSQRHL